MALWTAPTPAAAAGTTWYVNSGPSGNDDHSCRTEQKPCKTIHGALRKASDGDTIDIAAGTYAGGFTVDKSVSFRGAGAGQTVVTGTAPVVTITQGARVTAADLSISGGAGRAEEGGGILNEGTLALLSTVISNNSVREDGGGIENEGTLTVRGGAVTGNSAGRDGGGIHNAGTLSLSDTTVSGNVAENAGALWNDFATTTVSNSVIAGNSAAGQGGGIYNYGTLRLENSTVEGNSGGMDGGGIESEQGAVVLGDSLVDANRAPFGRGGGLLLTGGNLAIEASTVSDNSARLGGGLYTLDSVAISNSTLAGNSAASGGGVYAFLSETVLTLTSVTISANAAKWEGGGIVVRNRHTTLLTNVLLAGNFLGGNSSSPGADCTGNLTDGAGHNLVGVGNGCGLHDGIEGDRVGSSGAPIAPLLGPLAGNGGPTPTMALEPGSPAIGNADVPACESAPIDDLDQRGLSRQAASRNACDIGAYDTGGS